MIPTPELDDRTWALLNEAVQRLEESWQATSAAELAEFVPPPEHPLRERVLIELIKVDQEYRWKAGQPQRLEAYLGDWPELGGKPAVVVELAEAECLTRAVLDTVPTREELQERFPEICEQIDLPGIEAKAKIEGPRRPKVDSPASWGTSTETLNATPSTGNSVPTLPAQRHFGRYEIIDILGQGGMGTVYLAQDEELQRRVAVKVPHRDRFRSSEEVDRFLEEARTAANLKHPAIVPVYDFGRQDDSTCFVVMEYLQGKSLAEVAKSGRVSHVRAVELIVQIADALHYAHKCGVVHRDIKPSNILIDAAGKPYVADFGLALKEADVGKGKHGQGTPAYMSPEQARGEGHLVDGRSDIFSLGVVFYELLTGVHPFHGRDKQDTLKRIKTMEPRPPRQRADTIPKELERICLKALCKRATDRYTTALDMAEDLRHWASERETKPPEPVSADMTSSVSVVQPVQVVPKGLRSFGANDADFFLPLLPGPYDRNGVPEAIRFWMTLIEAPDPDETFRVGLVYGPSGCGKSSLMKAGLLPLLAEHIVPVYVEATPGETEIRLLKALRKKFPSRTNDRDLTECLSHLRRGRGIDWGQKLLVVLDQFEQWLHAKHNYADTELVQALRQCDGARVQCIVIVRDDFWMAATRFMRDLEVPLMERQNSAAVDLFDLPHARKVLSEFGRAYGRLPADPTNLTKEQSEFLDAATGALAQDDRAIPVRLSLFAEMVKGKAWTPATLKDVGGAEGIGLKFLQETFDAVHAPPEHRLHQKAIRAVLSALLPEEGSDLRGSVRSREELLRASGYVEREKDFDSVLRILDTLHLITPSDPDGVSFEESTSRIQTAPGEKYYQLTHDYLVPSLREWLNRKRRETRRGRAELLLDERTRQWSQSRDTRLLPSPSESLNIALYTRRAQHTACQRGMLRRAWGAHARKLTVGTTGAILIAVVTLALWNAFFRSPDQSELLKTFADRDANSQERIKAFDGLNLDNSFVLLATLQTLRDVDNAAVTRHAISRLLQIANEAREFDDAKMRGSVRDQVVQLLLHLLDEGPNDIQVDAFNFYVGLASPLTVLQAIQERADRAPGELTRAMAKYLSGVALIELPDKDVYEVLRTLNVMIEDDFNDELVNACVARLHGMPPDEMVTRLIEACEPYDIEATARCCLVPYLRRAGQTRVDAIGNCVQDRLVKAASISDGEISASSELEFLIQALGQIQPLSHTQYRAGFDDVNGILQKWETLDDASMLNTVIEAFVLLKPPDKGREVSLDPLRQLLCEGDWPTREAAATALGDLNDLNSIDDLRECARKPEPKSFFNLQIRAIESLTKLGGSLKQKEPDSSKLENILITLREVLAAYKEEQRDVVNAALVGYRDLASSDHIEVLFPLLSETAYNLGAIKAVLQILVNDTGSAETVVPTYLEWRTEGYRQVQGIAEVDDALIGFYAHLLPALITQDATEAGAGHPAEVRKNVETAARSVLEALAEARAKHTSESVRDHARRLMEHLLDANDCPGIDPDEDDARRERQFEEWQSWWQEERGQFRLTGQQLSRSEKGS